MLMLQQSPDLNSFILQMEMAYSSELSEQTLLHGLKIQKPIIGAIQYIFF